MKNKKVKDQFASQFKQKKNPNPFNFDKLNKEKFLKNLKNEKLFQKPIKDEKKKKSGPFPDLKNHFNIKDPLAGLKHRLKKQKQEL